MARGILSSTFETSMTWDRMRDFHQKVTKVTRDTMMVELAREFPGYGFERHKGYGTAEHHAAIARRGLTPHHRRSFKPVQLALGLPDAEATEAVEA